MSSGKDFYPAHLTLLGSIINIHVTRPASDSYLETAINNYLSMVVRTLIGESIEAELDIIQQHV